MAVTEGINPGLTNFNPFLFEQLKSSKKEKTERTKRDKRTSFLSLLAPKNDIETEFDFDAIQDNVRSAGDALKKNPCHAEMKNYRDAIQKFIYYVVNNSFDIKNDHGIKRINKPQKNYINIEIIDKKLEKLGIEIVSGQVEQIKLLASIDEITGLVIDLFE